MQGNTLSIDSVLAMLTPLSNDNKKWIADKLYEQVESDHEVELDKAIKAAHTEDLHHADTVEQLMAGLLA